jgi:hypothetical protein
VNSRQSIKQVLIRQWFEEIGKSRKLNRRWGDDDVFRLCHKTGLQPEELADMIWSGRSLRKAPAGGWSGPVSLHLTHFDQYVDHVRLGSPIRPIVPAFAID